MSSSPPPSSSPLSTSPSPPSSSSSTSSPSIPTTFNCLICASSPSPPSSPSSIINLSFDDLLQHLTTIHNFTVFEAPSTIATAIPLYIDLWREVGILWKGEPSLNITHYCNHKENDQVNLDLKNTQLTALLMHQQLERKEKKVFERKCLFCKLMFDGDRDKYLGHLWAEHGFRIGHPDNIIFLPQLLDLVDKRIHNMQCIYCCKSFPNHEVLRKHMRKKKHFRIHPKDHSFDAFYMINYLEPGKDWQHFLLEDDDEENYNNFDDVSTNEEDEEWDEWQEQTNDEVKCLFCSQITSSAETCFNHMKEIHGFDFQNLRQSLDLDFYSSIKLINFIRGKINDSLCPQCEKKFETFDQLQSHLKEDKHYSISSDKIKSLDNEFLKPVLEGDPLLYNFSDGEDEDDDDF